MIISPIASHLLQMRGLKLLRREILNAVLVASFTDAWIETSMSDNKTFCGIVASFTDAWIETVKRVGVKFLDKSHLLQMRGLKPFIHVVFAVFLRRIFYRCVD